MVEGETFGPVIPVTVYADVEEAIRLANASIYGLSAAVIEVLASRIASSTSA